MTGLNDLGGAKQKKGTGTKKTILVLMTIVLLCFGIDLSLDYGICVLPPCLTKFAAYKKIQVGDSSGAARSLLFRAGVSCPGESIQKCQTIMFSDFWKDYMIVFDEISVKEKIFSYRIHGKGLLGRLHALR
jgi:hypothetical protein